jgi:hypothetical protein
LLRSIPALQGEWLISGLIYDVATRLVDIVVPPARVLRKISIHVLPYKIAAMKLLHWSRLGHAFA